MKVSVIIPAYNEEKYITGCLESILQQTEPADEIIVVDNNSTDNTAKIARSYGVRIIKEKQQGMIVARNKGFNNATYEVIARTDADAIVPRDWIKRIKKAFTKNDDLLGYSGPATFHKIPKVMQPKNLLFGVWFEPFKLVFGHDCLIGPNMAIRKSAWEKVKHDVCLEDNIVHEDMDLSYHLGRIGKITFDNKLVVNVSPRKFKKIHQYLEYGGRNLRTIQHHKYSLHPLKIEPLRPLRKNKRVKKILTQSKTLVKQLKQLPNQL